jgi:hypothetical protein
MIIVRFFKSPKILCLEIRDLRGLPARLEANTAVGPLPCGTCETHGREFVRPMSGWDGASFGIHLALRVEGCLSGARPSPEII